MAILTQRTTAPITSNAYYYADNPFYQSGYGLPNCTCYAFGRFWEAKGGPIPSLSWNDAGQWWYASDGYDRGQSPKVGAILCWSKAGAAGHVAFVEAVNSDGTIWTTDSQYNGQLFRRMKRSNNGNWSGGDYTFQGFIYNPTSFEGSTGGTGTGGSSGNSGGTGTGGGSTVGGVVATTIEIEVTFNEGIKSAEVYDMNNKLVGKFTSSGTIPLPSNNEFKITVYPKDEYVIDYYRIYDANHCKLGENGYPIGDYTTVQVENSFGANIIVEPLSINQYSFVYLNLHAILIESILDDINNGDDGIFINYGNGLYREHQAYIFTAASRSVCDMEIKIYNSYTNGWDDQYYTVEPITNNKGTCYDVAVSGRSHNANNTYMLSVIKLTIPSYSGECIDICFPLNYDDEVYSNNGGTIRYALCHYDNNLDMYKNSVSEVSDANQIQTGVVTVDNNSRMFSIPMSYTIGGELYLILWPYSAEDGATIKCSNIAVTHTNNGESGVWMKYKPVVF